MQNHTTLFSLSLALALAAGCSRSNPDTVYPYDETRTLPAEATDTKDDVADTTAPPATTPSVGAGDQTAPAEAPMEYKTTDDEIFGVLETINDEEIETAELAKQWAKSNRVKEYAILMIKEHRAANERQEETRQAMGLRATDSRTSDNIERNLDQKRETLEEVPTGDPFDRAYIDIMVESHASVIEMIDKDLLPNAQMPALRSELQSVRAAVESHLNIARQLQEALTKPQS